MELSYKEIRAQICDVCHKMWQLGGLRRMTEMCR